MGIIEERDRLFEDWLLDSSDMTLQEFAEEQMRRRAFSPTYYPDLRKLWEKTDRAASAIIALESMAQAGTHHAEYVRAMQYAQWVNPQSDVGLVSQTGTVVSVEQSLLERLGVVRRPAAFSVFGALLPPNPNPFRFP